MCMYAMQKKPCAFLMLLGNKLPYSRTLRVNTELRYVGCWDEMVVIILQISKRFRYHGTTAVVKSWPTQLFEAPRGSRTS